MLAYELSGSDDMNDLQGLIQTFYAGSDSTVETTPEMGGSNYAAVITDGRAPHGSIVWNSCNFYITGEY